ncbi:MAG: class I SAM-dependent methyltransferase [Rubrobacteraceae bacterium]
MGSSYTFGEGDIASRRLGLLSEVFESTSREFLAEAVDFRPEVALDLGCGPGHTTRLVAEVLEPDLTIGVERSAAFLSEARAASREGVAFIEGDVTDMPLPAADVIFVRFLLGHLPLPEKIVAKWTKKLNPGGLLLLEEVEEIRTREPTLRRYLDIVSAMLAHHGSELCVGPRLDAMLEGVTRTSSLEPTLGEAARMFSMNLATWREDEFIRETYAGHEMDDLEASLLGLTGSRTRGDIVWRLRRIVIERDGNPSPRLHG